MNAPFTLTDERADYLRELMNIGSGNAAATLSFLLKTSVVPKIPQVWFRGLDEVLAEVGAGGEPATGTIIELSGDVSGLFLFYCQRDSSRRFAALARLHEPRRSARFDDLAVISIVAQVVAGSHLATIRRFCGLHIDHTWKESTPDMARTLREGLTAWRDAGNEKVVVVQSEFALVDFNLSTFLVIIPDQRSLPVLTGSAIEAKRRATGPSERPDPTAALGPSPAAAPPEVAARIRLSETELDYLTELMNIGAGNAAQTLSILLHHRVNSAIPSVLIRSTGEITAELEPQDEKLVGVRMNLLGDVSGFVYFLVPVSMGRGFSAMVRPRGQQNTEMNFSALVTLAAQAVVTSYMAAVKKFCGLDIKPSLATPIADMAHALAGETSAAGLALDVLVVQSEFAIGGGRGSEGRLTTNLLMFTEPGSIPVLTGSIAEATRRITAGA